MKNFLFHIIRILPPKAPLLPAIFSMNISLKLISPQKIMNYYSAVKYNLYIP